MIIDIDKFKEKNDTYGHSAGDLLLVQAAQRLMRAVRQGRITMPNGTEQPSSIEDTDFVARFGGEEFVILLSNVNNASDLESLGSRVVQSFNSEKFLLDSTMTIPVTASVGGAIPFEGEDPTNALQRADERLYKAKESGRNQFIGEQIMVTT